MICRTHVAEKLVLNAVDEKYINLDKISPKKVKQSGYMMESKKKDIKARFLIRKFLGKEIPRYKTKLLKPGFNNYIRGFFVYFNTIISSKTYLKKFISKIIPFELWLMKKIIGDK